MEELNENLIEDNSEVDNIEEKEVENEEKSQPIIDTEETVIKDFFIKETGVSLKEMAILFGQTEEEISKEYGTFKAKKIYAKLDYVLPKFNVSYEEFKSICQSLANYGFKSITVLPTFIGLAKDLLAKNNLLVRALISYPHGEDFTKVKVYSVKQAIKSGADAIAVVVSSRRVKNGNYKVIIKTLKKIVKIAKNKPVTAILNAEDLTSLEIEKISNLISKECKLYSIMPCCFNGEVSKFEEIAKGVITAVNGKCHVDFLGDVPSVLETVNLFTAGVNSITNKNNLDVASELNNKIISSV